ncbi:hypothetical protein BKA65DRAFT_203760 [Rhexocercosporidium sp. MPI-PUGE-AT-0058]|nr:hypothetical protein BKA65DRAFT_203760 [Rhexocercosporidium sp. MPI-PUGE-AT-0058]
MSWMLGPLHIETACTQPWQKNRGWFSIQASVGVDSQLCWYRRKMKATSTNDVYAAVQKKIRLDDAGSNDVADAGWAEDMLLDHDVGHTGIKDFDEDEPLLSQTSDVASSFFLSQASTLSNSYTNNLLGPDDTSLTGPHFEWSSSPMGSSAPSRLAEVAFGALMGASISRQDLGVRDVDMKDHPQLSISTLVPSMFSPGFKNSMADNCRLLPTVTHALSISLPRTVQTPSLRRKLVQLSNMNVSQFQNSQDLGQVGTTERLSSVVQLRIWEMMQRKLFDKSAERRLWRQARAGEEEAEDDFEDILETSDGGGLKWETGAGQGFSHAEMLFWDDDDDDDLLLGDDNAYCEIDWERRAIEQYTDEMLLDDVWSDNWRDGREEMLLEDSDHDNLENGEERSILLFEESDDEMLLIRDGETSIFPMNESDNEVLETMGGMIV